MNDDIVTFAEILQTQRGHFTGYGGKWHWKGDAKPGWSNTTSDYHRFITQRIALEKAWQMEWWYLEVLKVLMLALQKAYCLALHFEQKMEYCLGQS